MNPKPHGVDTFEAAGVDPTFGYHDWVQWRSLYFDDPDGNHVEFVCYEPRTE